MMKNRLTFRLDGNQMSCVTVGNSMISIIKKSELSDNLSNNKFEIIDIKELKKTWNKIKKDWFGHKAVKAVGGGIFWGVFLTHIFPYVLDISKVFCLIKIVQGFYEERRGGRDGASGMQSLMQYGKWLIIIHLLPIGVELIDQIGITMMNDINTDSLKK